MLKQHFRVAMQGRIFFGSYDNPGDINRFERALFIVQRSGRDGRFLSLGKVGSAESKFHKLPAELTPRDEMVGLKLHEAPESARSAKFILCRQVPLQYSGLGPFFPSDGFVSLNLFRGRPALSAWGRYSHRWENRGGFHIPIDVPTDGSDTNDAQAWFLELRATKWDGEMLGL